MTTRQVINKLISEGHKVSFYQSKDGGVRITKIDSQSFTGSEGNTRARAMTGEALSERRSSQLKKFYMKTPKGTWGHKKSKRPPLPEEAKKLIRKAQRIFRKSGVIAGTSSTARFRRNIELFMKQGYSEPEAYAEAVRRLKQNIRYAQGLAYEENVEHLVNLLRTEYLAKLRFRNEDEKRRFIDLINKMEANKSNFKDKWISEIRNKLYAVKDREISVDNLISDIEEILIL